MKSRESVKNQTIDLAVATADSMDLTAIFALFITETGRRFVEEIGHFFMFPIAAMASGIRAILAWRQLRLDGNRDGALAKAVVETISATAVTVAVVGGLVAASVFATLSPIIFTIALAAKTLFHLGASIYYAVKYFGTDDKEQKQKYAAMARGNAIGALALALATVAVGFVMLAAKPIVGILGVLGGLIGTVYGLYKLYKTPTLSTATSQKAPENNLDQAPLLRKTSHDLTHDHSLTADLASAPTVTVHLSLEQQALKAAGREAGILSMGDLLRQRGLFAEASVVDAEDTMRKPAFSLPPTPTM